MVAGRGQGPVFSAMYGGYFGAGNGILMLAAMGLLGLHDINRANGIKNFLGICINSIAVLSFSLKGLVVWPDALLMAVAAALWRLFRRQDGGACRPDHDSPSHRSDWAGYYVRHAVATMALAPARVRKRNYLIRCLERALVLTVASQDQSAHRLIPKWHEAITASR